MIWIGLLGPLWSWAQQHDPGLVMAQRLGLCEALMAKNGQAYEAAPCQDCNITYLPLIGTGQQPELFFIEIESATHCGSGGCSGEVYQRRGPAYRRALGLFGYFERSIPRSGAPPDLVYLHTDTGSRDYTGDGEQDRALVWLQYRWDCQKASYLPHDLLRLEVRGRSLPLSQLRRPLLQDWRKQNRWSF